MGTRHLAVRNLADRDLISPKLFIAIYNAMAIRRFGLQAVEPTETAIYNKDKGSAHPQRKEVTHHEKAAGQGENHSPIRASFP